MLPLKKYTGPRFRIKDDSKISLAQFSYTFRICLRARSTAFKVDTAKIFILLLPDVLIANVRNNPSRDNNSNPVPPDNNYL